MSKDVYSKEVYSKKVYYDYSFSLVAYRAGFVVPHAWMFGGTNDWFKVKWVARLQLKELKCQYSLCQFYLTLWYFTLGHLISSR